jgi:hypothetical protein
MNNEVVRGGHAVCQGSPSGASYAAVVGAVVDASGLDRGKGRRGRPRRDKRALPEVLIKDQVISATTAAEISWGRGG